MTVVLDAVNVIERYTLPEMGDLWSETYKLKTWLDVEIAVCEAQAELGYIPAAAVEENGRTWIGWFCLLFFSVLCLFFSVLFCSVLFTMKKNQRREEEWSSITAS